MATQSDKEHDTEWTYLPVCPHCGDKDDDWHDLNLDGDGDTTIAECKKCEEEYEVQINISVNFTTKKIGTK